MRNGCRAYLGWILGLIASACTGGDDGPSGTKETPDAAQRDAGKTDASASAGTGGSGGDGRRDARDGGRVANDAGADGGALDASGRDAGTLPPATLEPLVVGGSRLTVQLREDGVAFRWFLDTAHDEMPCEFRKVGETFYCMPLLGAPEGRYADADCTEPVAFVEADPCAGGVVPGQVVQLWGTEACAVNVPVRVGETTVEGPIYSDTSGDCVELEASEDAEGAWHTLEELEPSEFVSAAEQLVEAGDLVVRRLVAADGSALNLEVLTPDGETCVHVRGRCVPGAVAYATGGLHADSDCTDATRVANATYRCEEQFD